MIITLKNKDTLIVNDFRFKCCIGKGGFAKDKYEGDNSTPIGKFEIGTLFWRPDRVNKPKTKLSCKKINKKMGWCTDIRNNYYNKEIKINNKIIHEINYWKELTGEDLSNKIDNKDYLDKKIFGSKAPDGTILENADLEGDFLKDFKNNDKNIFFIGR